MSWIPDRDQQGCTRTSDLLAQHIARQHAAERRAAEAERQCDQAIRIITALRFELELERQRSAALKFEVDTYRERDVV